MLKSCERTNGGYREFRRQKKKEGLNMCAKRRTKECINEISWQNTKKHKKYSYHHSLELLNKEYQTRLGTSQYGSDQRYCLWQTIYEDLSTHRTEMANL